MTLASGESDIPACGPPASFYVHLASSAVTAAGLSTILVVTVEEMCIVCVTCSLLMLVEDARGDHMEEAYSRAGVITAL